MWTVARGAGQNDVGTTTVPVALAPENLPLTETVALPKKPLAVTRAENVLPRLIVIFGTTTL